jgi:hypothetical protein
MTERDDSQHGRTLDLSPDDQRLLDALMDAGFDGAKLPASLGRPLSAHDERRLEILTRLLGFMDDYPVEDLDPALLHATLARIDRHEDQLAQRMRFDVAMEKQTPQRGFRIRLPDFVTVAAVLLIAVGVLWPVLGSIRNQAIDAACANNLKRIGYGFDQYANDNNGSMPLAMAGPMGTWETLRNTMNLNPMVQNGYCDAGHLNCPGHHHEVGEEIGPSYSYRWFTPRAVIHWNTGRVTVILGDLNPLVDAARSGWDAPPLSVSVNHGGRGQNVLTSDGATMWLEQPLVGSSDNIWMPNQAAVLRPGVMPSDDADVFLVH